MPTVSGQRSKDQGGNRHGQDKDGQQADHYQAGEIRGERPHRCAQRQPMRPKEVGAQGEGGQDTSDEKQPGLEERYLDENGSVANLAKPQPIGIDPESPPNHYPQGGQNGQYNAPTANASEPTADAVKLVGGKPGKAWAGHRIGVVGQFIAHRSSLVSPQG